MNKAYSQKELKEIYSKILKAIKSKKEIKNISRIAALDILFSDKLVFASAVVLDYPSLRIIESKTVKSREIIPYSQNWNAFREGVPLVEVYKLLDTKPDVIIINKPGIINSEKVATPSYVGVLINKPIIGVASELFTAILEEDKLMFKGQQVGLALKTKSSANPIYVTPGFNISIEDSVKIINSCLREHKMPEPIHIAHKLANKIKRREKQDDK